MIMAYDESYETGPAGPVAGLPFVEKSILYALNLVPGEKIVLGLPFYGRIWSNSGGYPQGYGISNERIEQFISTYGGRVVFDKASQSPKATVTIKPWDTKPLVGGKALAPGTYTIWFENEFSLKGKLSLVEKYNLKGTGSWSLGQEQAETWDYYKYWLNGCAFEDIRHSWAKEQILQAYVKGWITGFSKESFMPEKTLTRAQAAAMLVRIMNLDVRKHSEYAFDDSKGCWAEEYINTARKHGLVSGVENNLFKPDSPISRQEVAVMLNNILGYSAQGSVPAFSDVSQTGNSWSYEAICALSQKGLITGYPDMTFRPEYHITRAEMTALLTRVYGA
ncbi:MAG: hypothetical protein GX254_07195 [Clostridiales bacterium]|jgi:hypothetical protein|nr:hypothetical protein [Clostridiales bacterium]